MPFPKILFNASTGSDTAASGAGPTTALTGSGASTTNAGTTINLSADSPNLSGVATDGSAAIWVNTSTGRQYGRISAVDNVAKTVTTSGLSWGVTASGQTWAIGGKRSTLDAASSRTLFSATGWQPGWEVLLETDQTITSALAVNGPNAGGIGVIRSNTQSTLRKITCTSNSDAITWTVAGFRTLIIEDIAIENTNATKTAANGITATGSGSSRELILRRCILGHITNTLRVGLSNGIGFTILQDTTIRNCTSFPVDAAGNLFAYGCVFHSNANAVRINGGSLFVSRCLFYSNTNENLLVNPAAPLVMISDSTLDSATTDNLSTNFGSGGGTIHVVNCNLTKGGGFGIRAKQINELPEIYTVNCNFGSGVDANTSGASTVAGSVGEIGSLAVTPTYVNRSTANYGPGSAIIGQGYPKSPATLGDSIAVATSSIDIGAFQSAGGGSGGGLRLPRPMNGGYSA